LKIGRLPEEFLVPLHQVLFEEVQVLVLGLVLAARDEAFENFQRVDDVGNLLADDIESPLVLLEKA